jgi:hypothetical protein
MRLFLCLLQYHIQKASRELLPLDYRTHSHAPAVLSPRKVSGADHMEGWAGPRALLDEVRDRIILHVRAIELGFLGRPVYSPLVILKYRSELFLRNRHLLGY